MAENLSKTESAEIRPYRPNRLLRWFYRRFFGKIRVDESWSGQVRDAAKAGVVIYIMRSISFLDFLCLDFLTKRFGLPLVRFTNNLGLWILEPFGKGERRLRLRAQRPEQEALSEVVEQRQSALLFLRKPPKLVSRRTRGERLDEDLILTLVQRQRGMDVPIQLVPQTFVWSKRPAQREPGLVDIFFGPVEWPGRVRVFFQFLLNRKNARLRAGEAFDLKAFVDQNNELSDERLADKVRYALLRRMERERTLVLGPTKKTPGRMRAELLRSPKVKRAIASEARAKRQSEERVLQEATKELRKLQATQMPYMLSLLEKLLDWLFKKIYSGVQVDEDGMRRIREAGRKGTLVYLPSHKSHIDYLVLSYVLHERALVPPLIAAGDNLSFFPAGPILRRGGAFFIKRSFRGKKLYAALVDAYLKKLIGEGFPVEFFIEGGRSRTGRLRKPQLGLLSMVVDAAMSLRRRDIYFVPTAIGYDQIIEGEGYMRELSGGEKRRESAGALIRARRVLRKRYGRLYVNIGEIFSLEEAHHKLFGVAAGDVKLTPPQRRDLIRYVAGETISQIHRATTLSPSSLVGLALLSDRPETTVRDLRSISEDWLAALRARGVNVSDGLLNDEGTLADSAFDEAIELFLDDKIIEHQGDGLRAVGTRRTRLEFNVNNIAHFLIPSALVVRAILSARSTTRRGLPLSELTEKVESLLVYLGDEYTRPHDLTLQDVLEEAVETLVEEGVLLRIQDELVLGASLKKAYRYASLIAAPIEARLACVQTVLIQKSPIAVKRWAPKALHEGQRMCLRGDIERREALSKPRLEAGLALLREQNIVQLKEDEILLIDEPGALRLKAQLEALVRIQDDL